MSTIPNKAIPHAFAEPEGEDRNGSSFLFDNARRLAETARENPEDGAGGGRGRGRGDRRRDGCAEPRTWWRQRRFERPQEREVTERAALSPPLET